MIDDNSCNNYLQETIRQSEEHFQTDYWTTQISKNGALCQKL